MPQNTVYPLWPGQTAPYTECSGGQAQPSVKEYAVPGAKSAMIVCPGGGYGCKVDAEKEPVVRVFNAAGISAYVLDYRVRPCHPETPLADASRAIRLVRSMGYEKVGICGFSAGGHVCLCASTLYAPEDPNAADPVARLSARPDAFVAGYPVVSFQTYRHQGSVDNLLGERREDQSLLNRFSAERNVTRDTPPGFVFHSAADELVPVQNSIRLADAMAEKERPFSLLVFPGGRHGAGVAFPDAFADRWKDICVDWLRALGF